MAQRVPRFIRDLNRLRWINFSEKEENRKKIFREKGYTWTLALFIPSFFVYFALIFDIHTHTHTHTHTYIYIYIHSNEIWWNDKEGGLKNSISLSPSVCSLSIYLSIWWWWGLFCFESDRILLIYLRVLIYPIFHLFLSSCQIHQNLPFLHIYIYIYGGVCDPGIYALRIKCLELILSTSWYDHEIWSTIDSPLELFITMNITIQYTIIIITSRHQCRYPWPSLATLLNRPSLPAGLQGYILYRHNAVVCRFSLFVLPLLVHVKGSIGARHLWVRPYFFSSVPYVWFV